MLFGSLVNYVIWRFKTTKTTIRGQLSYSDTSIYYEIHGNGTPLLLLHGGLTSVELWHAQLPELSKHFQLIIIDMRGHGRSKIGRQTFSYDLLTADTLEVLNHLKLNTVDVLGWSDGGIVGLKLAINNPERVNRLIAISANYNPDGLTQEAVKEMKHATPSNHSLLARLIYYLVAPESKQWNKLWCNVTSMWAENPQITLDELTGIKADTLLIQGENDVITEKHFNEMVTAIPNAEQLIIADTGHNVLQLAPDSINAAVHRFLKKV